MTDLFNMSEHGTIAYVRGSPTSKAAAEKIAPVTGKLRKRVYGALVLAGTDGMTDLELQEALEMKGSTERPRRCELMASGHIHAKHDQFSCPVIRDGSQVWVVR